MVGSRPTTVARAMKRSSRAGGTSVVGCGDGIRGPIGGLVNVAGGGCAAAVDGAPVISVEGPALPAEGGNPKRCSEASLARMVLQTCLVRVCGKPTPVHQNQWRSVAGSTLRIDRTDRIDAVSSAPGAGSLLFFILLADSCCRAENCSFLPRPNSLAGVVSADDVRREGKRSTWGISVWKLLTDSVNNDLLSRSGDQMSYNEIRLVPGKEHHRSVAELAQARKGMRHREG